MNFIKSQSSSKSGKILFYSFEIISAIIILFGFVASIWEAISGHNFVFFLTGLLKFVFFGVTTYAAGRILDMSISKQTQSDVKVEKVLMYIFYGTAIGVLALGFISSIWLGLVQNNFLAFTDYFLKYLFYSAIIFASGKYIDILFKKLKEDDSETSEETTKETQPETEIVEEKQVEKKVEDEKKAVVKSKKIPTMPKKKTNVEKFPKAE